jgi:hypothetical protein
MFDQEIAHIVRTGRAPDLIPYVCQNPRCQKTTYAPAGLIAITCGHCGMLDNGTELAVQGWRESIKRLLPAQDLLAMVVGILALAWAVLA